MSVSYFAKKRKLIEAFQSCLTEANNLQTISDLVVFLDECLNDAKLEHIAICSCTYSMNEICMHLDIAIEGLIKRVQRIQPMSEEDAKRIAAHLINDMILSPGALSKERVERIISLDREVQQSS